MQPQSEERGASASNSSFEHVSITALLILETTSSPSSA